MSRLAVIMTHIKKNKGWSAPELLATYANDDQVLAERNAMVEWQRIFGELGMGKTEPCQYRIVVCPILDDGTYDAPLLKLAVGLER